MKAFQIIAKRIELDSSTIQADACGHEIAAQDVLADLEDAGYVIVKRGSIEERCAHKADAQADWCERTAQTFRALDAKPDNAEMKWRMMADAAKGRAEVARAIAAAIRAQVPVTDGHISGKET